VRKRFVTMIPVPYLPAKAECKRTVRSAFPAAAQRGMQRFERLYGELVTFP